MAADLGSSWTKGKNHDSVVEKEGTGDNMKFMSSCLIDSDFQRLAKMKQIRGKDFEV